MLVPVDLGDLPFTPRRLFVVTGVPASTTRGGHAHRSARQLLYSPTGGVTVSVRTLGGGGSIRLDRCDRGLLIEPGVWSTQQFAGPSTVLIAFSSEPYRADSYLDEPTV
jgi:hypothetical protein